MPVSRKRKNKFTHRPVHSSQRPAQGMIAARAASLERTFGEVLAHCKRQIACGAMDEATKDALLALARIGEQVTEFNLWLDDSPETQWLKG